MSRNVESHFALNPTNIDLPRSKFDMSHGLITSWNCGDIFPILYMDILPGDTIKLKTSKVIRMPALIAPLMDNLYMDTYYFFVPNRLVWDHWQNLMGENTDSAWIPQVEYEVPQIEAPSGGWNVGTIADYFGVPTGVDNISVNALPFRAYALIMNEWFRSTVVTDPLVIPTNDTTVTGVNTGNYVTDTAKGGLPFVAAKYHDWYTSALPGPQRGPAVSISMNGEFPVFGNGLALGLKGRQQGSSDPLFQGLGNTPQSGVISGSGAFGATPGDADVAIGTYGGSSTGNIRPLGVPEKSDFSDAADYEKTGLIADVSTGLGFSVNALRTAFQIQKLLEKDARGGDRYISILKSHFGVTSPDSRLQRPEYLGGNRLPIQIRATYQQSETANTPQGNAAAYSHTVDSHADFVHSFVEHGMLIGLAVCRYQHTYSQGLMPCWSRKDRYSYYWPVLSSIGEQPIYNRSIFAQGTSDDDGVFGYQEAWSDYRYAPNMATSLMRPTATASLDMWHLGDEYQTLPYLSDSWIREDKSNLDRCLSVTSAVTNQFFGDFWFDIDATRPMPVYSIPGLIDHH